MHGNSTKSASEIEILQTLYTGPSPEEIDCIPADLKARPQWVLWRGADRIDQQTGKVKLNKIPIDPQTLSNADTTDPVTWGTCDQCIAALPLALEEWEEDDSTAYRGGGLGFVFTSDDPYTGVDLDHCRDPDTSAIADWAQQSIDALASYTEVTPSGTGMHILVQGALPPRGRRKGAVEMYDYARFFTMTGWHLVGTPTIIEARQDALTTFHGTIFGAPQSTPKQNPSPQAASTPLLDDTVLLDKARAAKNSGKFTRLWDGDITGYDSPSNADLALCILLAFWTQDPAQINRLFRQSGLLRNKWDEKRGTQTYGERTIAEALARQTEYYTLHDGVRFLMQRNSHKAASEGDQSQVDEKLPYSDVYNARRLVQAHGKDLHYCYPWGKWLTWTGTHWETEDAGESMRRAKVTAVTMVQDARQWLEKVAAKLTQAALGSQGEPLNLLNMVETDMPTLKAAKLEQKAAQQFFAHAASSLQDRRLKAMLAQAQSEPGIAILPQNLDKDPWLLNCLNGTLDLRTGELRSHQRGDLLTKGITVAYDSTAQCPTWDAFLDRIMARNQNLISFLQRAVGYALTGAIREHALLILWGTGRNGKSTFLNTLRVLLGPYALKAPSELLLVSNNDRHPTERADLFGKRFVSAIETEQGRRLAEVFVKEATGGDPIRARRMREDFWEFWPTHKVFLATNHKPVIKGTDNAIWERIRLIPFMVTISKDERDTTLPDKLESELPGILAWAVRGCLTWQKEGLGEPPEVQQATAGYRAEMDTIGQFIEDYCVTGNGAFLVTTKKLYEAYLHWCEANGEQHILNKNVFTSQLPERGFTPARIGHKQDRGWRGIGLLHLASPGGNADTTQTSADTRQTPVSAPQEQLDPSPQAHADAADVNFWINKKCYRKLSQSVVMPKMVSAVSAMSASQNESSPLAVGAFVWLLSADGVQQNARPYQVQAIAPGPDGRLYARFAETTTGWPLSQCECTAQPASAPLTSEVSPGYIPITPPPPEVLPASAIYDSGVSNGLAASGRTTQCPECGCRKWMHGVTSRICENCGYKDGDSPAEILEEIEPKPS